MSRELNRIITIVNENQNEGRSKFCRLTSSEIGMYNQYLMWGPDFEAFDEDAYRAFAD